MMYRREPGINQISGLPVSEKIFTTRLILWDQTSTTSNGQ